ncbi:TIMELESS-interacting protein [Onthophagus taurus]|uniref:TIMELESS-interacting protein n=1 Tax=Onthophagus taurus TaxID=166361 RepID=UPI0039BE28DF
MSSGEQSIHSEDEQEIESDRPVQDDHEGEEENKENDDEATEKRVVKPKRIIKNPRPKLNVDVLRGPKGLSCLENCFKNIKLKGTHGHEAEDLRVIMKTYEYWCHRLFPKYSFDDCLGKLENLGSKNNMKTYLKRIRLGMDDFGVSKPELSDEDDNDETDKRNVNSEFDLLQIEVNQMRHAAGNSQDLTEDQLERIRLNKEKAEHIRREKLKRMKEKAEMCFTKANTEEESISKPDDGEKVGECSYIGRNDQVNIEDQPSGFEIQKNCNNEELNEIETNDLMECE